MLSGGAAGYPLSSNPWSVGWSSGRAAAAANGGPTGKHSNAQSLHRSCIVPAAIAACAAASFGKAVGGSVAQPAEA
jgi:hypothetical protein